MECLNGEFCDLAKMINKISDEYDVGGEEIIQAMRDLIEKYNKGATNKSE